MILLTNENFHPKRITAITHFGVVAVSLKSRKAFEDNKWCQCVGWHCFLLGGDRQVDYSICRCLSPIVDLLSTGLGLRQSTCCHRLGSCAVAPVDYSDIPLLSEVNNECPLCRSPLVKTIKGNSVRKYGIARIRSIKCCYAVRYSVASIKSYSAKIL